VHNTFMHNFIILKMLYVIALVSLIYQGQTNSAFTLAAGHGMVQYGTVRHAYFCSVNRYHCELKRTKLG